jgi:hypothetical protein
MKQQEKQGEFTSNSIGLFFFQRFQQQQQEQFFHQSAAEQLILLKTYFPYAQTSIERK